MSAHRVVIVGGGFGGLQAALGLRRANVQITLIDRRNFHLFQPLSYQVATGALSPGEVAYPLRSVFKRNRNVRVILAEVERFDLERREVILRSVGDLPAPEPVPYDTLIVAGGSHYSYFGHDEWSEHAAEVKSLESALTVRSQILSAFEAAELEPDPERRDQWLTFAVVGAGPTGVEMAGQVAEIARDTLRGDFRSAVPGSGRILLVEAADRVLTGFPPSLSKKAERSLRRLGVTPVLGSTVVDVDKAGVTIEHVDGRDTTDPGANRRLGRRSDRIRPRLAAGRAHRCRAGPCRSRDGRARPHPARPSRGLRARRHGPRPRPRRLGDHPPRRRPRRHAAGTLRGQDRPRAPRTTAPRRRSGTATRATWPRSAAPPPSPTSKASGSAASSPG